MTPVSRIAGKIVFLAGFAGGVQIPEFINHYIQRLGGHLDEARKQLARFQSLADDQFAGDLESLIDSYVQNAGESVRYTGEIVRDLYLRVPYLEQSLQILQENALFGRTAHLLTQFDSEIVLGTLKSFVPALPFTVEALFCGVVSGCLGGSFWVLLHGLWRRWRISSRREISS